MTYNGSVFIPTQNVVIVQTDSDLQALPSSSSIVGYPYLSVESGLYYFTNSLVSLISTDLTANDNGGVYKLFSPQAFLYLDSTNQITNLNFNIGQIPLDANQILEGNVSNQASPVTVSGAITLGSNGVTSLTNGIVNTVALNSGISYVAREIAQGSFSVTPSGSPLTATINVTGILSSDYPNINISAATNGVPPYLFQSMILSNGVITIYFDSSNNPGLVTGLYTVSRPTSA